MEIYLLKFSACLAIFMVFYKLFLERERMHQLKRFYLLGAIFISLSFPLITFTTYVEPIVISNVTSFESLPEMSVEQGSVEAPATNYIPIILWSIYGLGVLLFGIKFILNLSKIVYKIKKNPKHVTYEYTHVLLRDLVTPHTFFSYIFLNKQKFETQQIPHEVFIHEQAHAKQKHSIDVLLVELLQIILWFNPLIYLTKQFIKMNHEFLADEAVIKQGVEPSNYQQLLLTFSSNVAEPQLANAINYSSIKKRFTVMKTHTSKQKIWLRSLLLLPLLALTLYGFSERKEVVIERQIIETIDLYLNEKGELLLDDKIILFSDIEKLYQQNNALTVSVSTYPEVTEEEKTALMSKIRAIGIKKFSICTSGKIISDLFEPGQDVSKSEEPGYEDINGKKVHVIENGNWSEVDSHLEERSQEQATPEEVAEYNKLAKHSNSELSKEHPVIKVKEVERMKFLYNKMSSDQKKNAVSFPDFSKTPPPPPPAKKTSIQTSAKKPIEIEEVRMEEEIINGKVFQYAINNGEKEYWDGYRRIDKKDLPQPQTHEVTEVIEANTVLTPPISKSNLDYVIDIAKKGALFYHEKKSISTEEAIILLKDNNNLNILIKQVNSKESKVYISENPIKIVTQNKSKEPILINGKKVKENSISMTKEDLAKASFSTEDGDITSFMFKIPGVKTESITGNKLNDTAQANLEKVQIGDAIQLFMIKDSKSAVHPPILITIIK